VGDSLYGCGFHELSILFPLTFSWPHGNLSSLFLACEWPCGLTIVVLSQQLVRNATRHWLLLPLETSWPFRVVVSLFCML